MNILLYSRAFPPATGGMERFAEDLAEWLSLSGHDVVVVTQTENSDDRRRAYRVLRAPSPWRASEELRKAEVIHINGCSIRGVVNSLAAGRPIVMTHQGHQFVCPTGIGWSPNGACSAGPVPGPCAVCPRRGPIGRSHVFTHRMAIRLARKNICVSSYLADRLGLAGGHVIHNPVADRTFQSASADSGEEDLVVFAGHLVKEKGLDLLLRALSDVPDARLDVLGTGHMRSFWEHLAEHVGVADRVSFRGEVGFEGVAEAYSRAAVVAVPSLWGEPFGYAAAEAMALGRTVVATPRGALPELLESRRGFISEDVTAGGFARALRAALQDRRTRDEVARRARLFAERSLAMEVIGPNYVKAYEEAAA